MNTGGSRGGASPGGRSLRLRRATASRSRAIITFISIKANAGFCASALRNWRESSAMTRQGVWATALALRVDRVPVSGPEVFALAAGTGLTAYDASYLWLARSRDAELATLDAALLRLTREGGQA